MMKLRMTIAGMALIAASQVFAASDADTAMASSDSKPCMQIAKACKAAGFSRQAGPSKRFWKDCMKPVVLGQSVKGVNVDKGTVQACRTDKVQKLQQELKQLQKAMSANS